MLLLWRARHLVVVVSPEELAARHPVLFHLTAAENVPGIIAHGLLPTADLVALFEVSADARAQICLQRRAFHVPVQHAVHGLAVITDNSPLSMKALADCLDDGLGPEDWLIELNRRVFFWVNQPGVESLLNARRNRGRDMAVLEFDTLRVAQRHHASIELCAINSGATIRKPVRRGRSTFTPMGRHTYPEWQRLRGGRDKIREVTLTGWLPDVARCCTFIRHYPKAEIRKY